MPCRRFKLRTHYQKSIPIIYACKHVKLQTHKNADFLEIIFAMIKFLVVVPFFFPWTGLCPRGIYLNGWGKKFKFFILALKLQSFSECKSYLCLLVNLLGWVLLQFCYSKGFSMQDQFNITAPGTYYRVTFINNVEQTFHRIHGRCVEFGKFSVTAPL